MSELKLNGKVVCIKKCEYFTLGKQYKVSFLGEATVILIDDDAEQNEWNRDGFEGYFNAVPTKNQRITALEKTVAKQGEEIAELKLIVAQIRKPSTEVQEALAINFEADADVIEFEGAKYKKVDREAREGDVVIPSTDSPHVNANKPYKVVTQDSDLRVIDNDGDLLLLYNSHRRPSNVDIYELTDGFNPQVPMIDETPRVTANELRAEIIEKAKEFVSLYELTSNLNFEVSTIKERIVVVRLVDENYIVKHQGVARCNPADVFNYWIGYAIALGRALGLDVSEFEQAVQPTLAIGQIVFETEDKTHRTISAPGFYEEESMLTAIDSRSAKEFSVIINDTNAQYGGAE